MAANTPAKRQNKKVAGSTYGMAKRAITKPVLQMITNIGAIALSKVNFMGNLLKILKFFYYKLNFRLFSRMLPLGGIYLSYAATQHESDIMVQIG